MLLERRTDRLQPRHETSGHLLIEGPQRHIDLPCGEFRLRSDLPDMGHIVLVCARLREVVAKALDELGVPAVPVRLYVYKLWFCGRKPPEGSIVDDRIRIGIRDGNKRLVQINRQRLSIPDDPILRIPQAEYHRPVKAAVTELRENINDVVGIVLYGSVARGEADRRSDIDLWVLTRSGRAESRREANAIARDLEDTKFDGGRYAYDIDVEAVQAIPAYTEDIREIVVSGIPVYKTSDFETVENLLLEERAADE